MFIDTQYSHIDTIGYSKERQYLKLWKDKDIYFGKMGLCTDSRLLYEISILTSKNIKHAPKIIDLLKFDDHILVVMNFYEVQILQVQELIDFSVVHIERCSSFGTTISWIRRFIIDEIYFPKLISLFKKRFQHSISDQIIWEILSYINTIPVCFMHWDFRIWHILRSSKWSVLIDWEDAWYYYSFYDIITLFQSIAFHKDLSFDLAEYYLKSILDMSVINLSKKQLSALILYNLISSFDLRRESYTIDIANKILDYLIDQFQST